ncbi:hypothetical protein [Borrelia sp. RT1S]|uniref:hypothetical protein n=1 Tax=Borrelia sp. RT1S TaxID=2898580 RepID=UPI001E4BA109|nr:hypothetical protein [Borrelia sp. RT1S]UGQ17809.1 hypothetical protein LSO05_05105 [Borrelia sp. RT1S]
MLQGIGDAIAGGFSASLAAVDSFNKEVETFSGMLGSEDLGKTLAEDMRAFGQETLFSQEAINNAATRLAKIGFATLSNLLAGLANSVSKVLTQDLGKAFAQNTAKGTDAFIASTVQASKDIVSNLGVWGQLAVAIFDFTVGIFKGIEAKAIAEIEKRLDEE